MSGGFAAAFAQGDAATLAGRSFFPHLISGSFEHGLREAFDFAAGASVVAAVASQLRGGKYIHEETEPPTAEAVSEPALASGRR